MEKHEVIKLLQSEQINPTRQRVDIAELLFERPQHLCAEQVLSELSNRGRGNPSKATVYNTLNLFSQQGLLRELYIESGKVYYDSNTREHHHIYNVDTGELWDVEGDSYQAPVTPNLPAGTTTIGVDIVYRVRGG